MLNDFYQTERVNDRSPDKIDDTYFKKGRDSDALLAAGKLTIQESLNANN